MSHYLTQLMSYIDRLGPQQWIWVMVAISIVGALCLRGFGSRKHF